MQQIIFDKEYAEFLLSKIYKIRIEITDVKNTYLTEIKLCFADEETAKLCSYYFCFRLLDKPLEIGLEVDKNNFLLFTLRNKKSTIISFKTNLFNSIEFSGYHSSAKFIYGMDVYISFNYATPENQYAIKPFLLNDKEIKVGLIGGLVAQLYKFGNDGFELNYEEIKIF
ncbi:MAG: hypothetical protein ABI405_04955 [Parafilimonas sp.]